MSFSIDKSLNEIIDGKTKPLKSLGRLEEIAFKIGKIQNSIKPELKNPHIVVFSADHGLAQLGVSPYPSEVTRQMVLNFVSGGAAINVFCRNNGISLEVVDSGVLGKEPFPEEVTAKKIAEGTKNSFYEDAMTKEQLNLCLQNGKEVVRNLSSKECNIIGLGEMGIGNTSSASLIVSAVLDLPLSNTTGIGAGFGVAGIQKKVEILEKVFSKRFSDCDFEPLSILRKVGGFEIAMMVGAYLQAYEENITTLIDGFISSAAFLLACKIEPKIVSSSFFSHASDSKGHRYIYEHFKMEPILSLGMRLGEGSGAAICYPIVKSSVDFLREMASFESAGVSSLNL